MRPERRVHRDEAHEKRDVRGAQGQHLGHADQSADLPELAAQTQAGRAPRLSHENENRGPAQSQHRSADQERRCPTGPVCERLRNDLPHDSRCQKGRGDRTYGQSAAPRLDRFGDVGEGDGGKARRRDSLQPAQDRECRNGLGRRAPGRRQREQNHPGEHRSTSPEMVGEGAPQDEAQGVRRAETG